MIDANVLNEKETSAPPMFPKAAAASGGSVKVRAISKGFDGVVRNPGEVFYMPAGSKGSWFVPVEKPAAAKAKGTVLSDADLA